MTPEMNCSSLLASGSFSRVAYHLEGGFPGGSKVKNLPANSGDAGLIPGSGRSPGKENGNLLQYFCLENPVDRGVGDTAERLSTPAHIAYYTPGTVLRAQ